MAFFNALNGIDKLGLTVGQTIGPQVVGAVEAINKFRQDVGPQVVGAINAMEKFGQETGPQFVGAVHHFGRGIGQTIGPHVDSAIVKGKDWITKHPGETVAVVGCVAAAPVAIALTPLALGAAGFTAGGVAAGMFTFTPHLST